MGTAISTLLTRNLFDVFGEMDPARRRAAIDEIFTEDCVFYDPHGGVYRGRDAIDRRPHFGVVEISFSLRERGESLHRVGNVAAKLLHIGGDLPGDLRIILVHDLLFLQ